MADQYGGNRFHPSLWFTKKDLEKVARFFAELKVKEINKASNSSLRLK